MTYKGSHFTRVKRQRDKTVEVIIDRIPNQEVKRIQKAPFHQIN